MLVLAKANAEELFTVVRQKNLIFSHFFTFYFCYSFFFFKRRKSSHFQTICMWFVDCAALVVIVAYSNIFVYIYICGVDALLENGYDTTKQSCIE